MNERPSYSDITDKQIIEISQELFNGLAENFKCCGISQSNIFDAIKEDMSLDGYEYAKLLENDFGAYSIDSMIVSELDMISYSLDRAKDELVKKWVTENKIFPKFDIECNVLYMRRGEQKGIIKGVDYDEAKYHIVLTETSCAVIPYEDVVGLAN